MKDDTAGFEAFVEKIRYKSGNSYNSKNLVYTLCQWLLKSYKLLFLTTKICETMIMAEMVLNRFVQGT